MRKEFREPELKRIELRLEESIAASTGMVGGSLSFRTIQNEDHIDETGHCRELYMNSGLQVKNKDDAAADIFQYSMELLGTPAGIEQYMKLAGCAADSSTSAMVLDMGTH